MPFSEPLYFKDGAGQYFEPGATGGYYWQQGVKEIPQDAFEKIMMAADASSAALMPSDADASALRTSHGYASHEHTVAVDDFAMTAALAACDRLWPREVVVRQPHNNPGFDIRVGSAGDVVRYVEVKGTTMPRPAFFLSEGERRFSVKNATRYTALIFYAIDLVRGTCELYRHDGAIAPSVFTLATRQWQCELADR